MRSNCIGCQRHVPVKCWVWSERMVLGRAPRSKSWPERSSRIWGDMTCVVHLNALFIGEALRCEQNPPDWQEILKYFRGSELQNYFTKVLEDNLKALIKPQYVDLIPKAIKGPRTVSEMLDTKVEEGNKKHLELKQRMLDELELNEVADREVANLSGGELQRFAIAITCIQYADV